jgi:hypothetical protein
LVKYRQNPFFFDPKQLKRKILPSVLTVVIFITLTYLIQPYEIKVDIYIYILDNIPEKYALNGHLIWLILVIIPRLAIKGFMEDIFEVFYISTPKCLAVILLCIITILIIVNR